MGDPLKVIIKRYEPHGKGFERDEVREAEATFAVGQRDRRPEPLKVLIQRHELHGKGLERNEVRETEATFAVGQRDRRLEPLKVIIRDEPQRDRRLEPLKVIIRDEPQRDRRLEPLKVIIRDEPHGKGLERDEVREAEATFAVGQRDRRLEPLKVRKPETETVLKDHPWCPATEMHPWLFPEGSPSPASTSKPHVAQATFPNQDGRQVRGAPRNTFYEFDFDDGPRQPQRSRSAPVTSIERSVGTIRCNFGFICTPCQYMPRDFKNCQLPACRTNFCKRDDEGNVVDLPKVCRKGVQCRHCHCHAKRNSQRMRSRCRRLANIRDQTG